jgi:hypothetical protein
MWAAALLLACTLARASEETETHRGRQIGDQLHASGERSSGGWLWLAPEAECNSGWGERVQLVAASGV